MKLTLPGNNHRHQMELLATPEYFEYHPAHVTPCLVDLNLTAPTFVEEDNTRAQVDLVAVIDRSGSMSGDKINLVKETLLFVLTQLTAKDRLCLIVYDDEVESVFELTYVTEESRSYLRSKINSVTVRVRTDLCGGLLEGMRTVTSRTGVMADVASVLLLTDGLANVGISSTRGILKAMRFGEKQKKKTVFPSFPGTVYTFGYGSNHNASMLKEISQAGNGMYFFIDTNEKISKSFTMCTRGLLSTVGQNINLLVELSNGATITEVIAKKTPTYNTNKTSVEVAMGVRQCRSLYSSATTISK